MEPHNATVFVIEDNPDNLYVVQRILRSVLKVKYLNARASGSQFFKWLTESESIRLNPGRNKLDLILLDIQLPREDGYDVLRQIRAEPVLVNTRVIAVTANVMPPDIARAREAGFDGFIGKPIDRHRFPDQIRRILQGESVWEAS